MKELSSSHELDYQWGALSPNHLREPTSSSLQRRVERWGLEACHWRSHRKVSLQLWSERIIEMGAHQVYETSSNPPNSGPDNKIGPYWYHNQSYTHLKVPQGEPYKMEFPKPGTPKYATKGNKLKNCHFCKYNMNYGHDTYICKELALFNDDQFHKTLASS